MEAAGKQTATDEQVELWKNVLDAADAAVSAAAELNEAWAALAAAQEEVSALHENAACIQPSRELVRQQAAKNISRVRHNDMFFRRLSNDALAKFDTAFDIAKTYTFLARRRTVTNRAILQV